MYLDLESVKKYLRVTEDTDDNLIVSMIKAAENLAENIIGRSLNKVLKNNNLPDDLKLALYMQVSLFYDNRGMDCLSNDARIVFQRYKRIKI